MSIQDITENSAKDLNETSVLLGSRLRHKHLFIFQSDVILK